MNNNYAIRKGNTNDLPAIITLFKEQLLRDPNEQLITDALRSYPSVVVHHHNEIVGFAYCGYMAPDLLELMNITVHTKHRASGVGSLMLQNLHAQAVSNYAAIMLTNSVLYTTDSKKRAATNFYLRNGYELVASTGSTNMFWKLLTK